MVQEAQNVRSWLFNSHKISVPDDWLEACIEWIHSESEVTSTLENTHWSGELASSQLYRVRLKITQHLKCHLISNAGKFLRQILYACLAQCSPLMCCFCVKLLIWNWHDAKLYFAVMHYYLLCEPVLQKLLFCTLSLKSG